MKTRLLHFSFVCASLLLTAGPASAQWITYWDYVRGGGTSVSNVATMTTIAGGVSQSASLTNFATGVTLSGVTVTMTNLGCANGGASGPLLAGTPAHATFNTFVDFTAGGIEVAGTAVQGLVISGLNPARTYSFSGTAARGNDPYTGRWVRCAITNVAGFVSAHTPGVITTTVGGTALGTHEAAFNSGRNHQAGQGDMVIWTNIAPSASGQIVVLSRIYNNTAPGVATDSKGYALAGFRLEEVAPAINSVTLSTPAHGTLIGAPAIINLTASAVAAVPETVGSVAYYYTNSDGVTFVGSSAAGTAYPVSTAALPAGDYGFYAVMTNSTGATAFSQTNVVTVIPPLASLTFLQQPSEQLAGAVIAPEIQVGATNSLGAAIVGLPVSLSLTGGGALGGTITQNTDGSGIAHFANLTVSTVGAKTLLATNAGSGISGTSLSFNITNSPPSVALINAPGDFLVGTSVTLEATATDSDGTVTTVSFYSGGRLLGSDPSTPFELRFHDLRSGIHSLVAVAFDNSGNTSTSAPVSITVTNEPGFTYLITNGAPWKYLDTGTNLGDSGSGTNFWIESSFDDSAWSTGEGELGYGNNTENPTRPAATTVSFGPDPNNKYIATYFRKQFTVADPSTFTNLVLKLIRDDGALIHINSNEVVRIGLPAGNISNTTLANGGPPDEAAFETYNVSPTMLVSGINTIAVEIHQAALNSSDTSFDLQLLAQGNVPLSILSSVYDANNEQLTLTWNSAPGAVYAIDNVQDITTPRALWDTLSGSINSQGTTTSFVIDAPYAGTFYSIRKQP